MPVLQKKNLGQGTVVPDPRSFAALRMTHATTRAAARKPLGRLLVALLFAGGVGFLAGLDFELLDLGGLEDLVDCLLLAELYVEVLQRAVLRHLLLHLLRPL